MSKKISQLDSTNELNDNDIFPIVNDSTTKKISFASLKTLLSQLFITNETDPTVPSWAKASKKPSYATSEITNDSGYITKEVNDLTNYELKTKTGSSIELSIDNSTYIITLKLKNSNGDIVSEKTIQLKDFVTKSDFSTFTTQLNQVLQELDETKADIEDVEELQTRVTELKQENEDLKKNQLTNTPEIATSHYLQDSADSRFRKFIPIGRTTQESTTGANVMKFTPRTVANQGINYICDNRGSVKLTGTATSGLELAYNQSQDKLTLASGTYKLKCVGNNIPTVLKRTDTNTSFNLDLNGEATITIDADNTEFRILIIAINGTTYNYDFYITLTPGTTATTERYTGGEPAPNPNYVIPYKNTGDNVNEFDISQIPSGSVITNNGDGTLTLANNINNNGYINTHIQFKNLCPNVKVGDTIVLNFKTTSQMENKNRIYISTVNIPIYKNTPIVVTQDMLDNYVAFYGGYNETAIISEIKLEKNSVPTPYSPYGCGNINEKIQNANFWEDSKRLKLLKLSYEDGTYSASDGDTRSPIQYKIQQYDIDDKYIANTQVSKTINSVGRYSFTSTKVENAIHVKIANNGSSSEFRVLYDLSNIDVGEKFTVILDIIDKTVGASKFKNVMLVKGEYTENNLPDYIPHSEQNPSFPLAEGQKFMEGSYTDDDEKVHHKRMQIVLDGSDDEVFDKRTDTNEIRYYLPRNMKLNGKIIANYFMQRQSSSDKNYVRAVGTEPVNQIMFKSELLNTDEMTIPEWRQWLSTHNLEIEYELAEEQTEDFTEEQKTAWEEIKKARTYKNITHISSEDETPANVELEYVVDINTIDDRITALEARVDLLEE